MVSCASGCRARYSRISGAGDGSEGVGKHTFGVSRPAVAIDVPRNFRCCARTRIVRLRSLPRVSIPPPKMRSPENTSVRARTQIGVGFWNAREGNFVLPFWQIFSADVR